MNYAELICTSEDLIGLGDRIHIPAKMGQPCPHQMQGTNADRLGELAGRVCYDSLGSENSRSSEQYHKHIADVGHLSIYEHIVFLFDPRGLAREFDLPRCIMNRPGVCCYPSGRLSVNLRALLEWNIWTARMFNYTGFYDNSKEQSNIVGRYLLNHLVHHDVITEQIYGHYNLDPRRSTDVFLMGDFPTSHGVDGWMTLFFHNVSRGFSHELCRHGDNTAISQRSTRYVDESGSRWMLHPLLCTGLSESPDLANRLKALINESQNCYKEIVSSLVKQGCDKKQARGAARGMLGNALETQLIFTASIPQWIHMINMRASEFADAEIRLVFNEVRDILVQACPKIYHSYKEEVKDCKDIGRDIKFTRIGQ